MPSRSLFQARMIEALGGPLMAAVTAHTADQATSAAAAMAELLNRSVQFGIALSSSMDLRGSDEQADAIRLALTGLAGGLIADIYRQTGQAPSEGDIRKWVPALEAVLAFSDNFVPSDEAEIRLDRLAPGQSAVDEHQAVIQYMRAFTPVVTEIGAFSFGRPDKKFIQEAAGRITARADAMVEALLPTADNSERVTARLAAVQALAAIYTACHRAEKQRLEQMNAQDRAAMSDASGFVRLETLWSAFEERAAMLEIVSGLMPGPTAARNTGTAAAPSPLAQPMRAPVQAPPVQSAPVQPAPAAPVEEPVAAKPSNPMGFFKPGAKKAADAPGENNDSNAA